jgi:hypothetical protein
MGLYIQTFGATADVASWRGARSVEREEAPLRRSREMRELR